MTQDSLFKMDTNRAVKVAMNRVAMACKLSREQIVDRLNDLAAQAGVSITSGRQLTRDTLDKWLNPNDRRKPDFNALTVFCKVMDDDSPLQALIAPNGGRLISRSDAARLDLIKAEEEMARLKAKAAEEEESLRAKMSRLREEIGL